MMIKKFSTLLFLTLFSSSTLQAEESRMLVEMPSMMQNHMMANMRDHMAALDEMLRALSTDQLDKVADIAEQRLGMSSLDNHGASHMAQVMPAPMRTIGTQMHRAASQLARVASEGDRVAAYDQLHQVTRNCVACHTQYRIR